VAYQVAATKLRERQTPPTDSLRTIAVSRLLLDNFPHIEAYWVVVYVEGGFCRERRFTADQAEARAYNSLVESRARQAEGLVSLGVCPSENRVVDQPTPGELARDFWDVRLLPRPQLTVVPDYAIVGKKVYLQIGGRLRTTFAVPNPIGADIGIHATSRYVVDWGDGSPPTTTTSQGGPWPDGDVTHVYDTAAAAVTIRVVQQWSARWSAGGAGSGTLDDLRTGGELTMRVEQVQPVRNR
jgi:hypothetical protein